MFNLLETQFSPCFASSLWTFNEQLLEWRGMAWSTHKAASLEKKQRMLQFLLQQFRLCLQCHFMAAFSVSEHAAWSGVSLYGFFFTRNFGLFKKWKTTRKHKCLHSVLISIEGSSHVKQGRISQWIIIRKKSDALLVHLPSSNLRSLYAHHFILLSSLTLPHRLCQCGNVRGPWIKQWKSSQGCLSHLIPATWSWYLHL